MKRFLKNRALLSVKPNLDVKAQRIHIYYGLLLPICSQMSYHLSLLKSHRVQILIESDVMDSCLSYNRESKPEEHISFSQKK